MTVQKTKELKRIHGEGNNPSVRTKPKFLRPRQDDEGCFFEVGERFLMSGLLWNSLQQYRSWQTTVWNADSCGWLVSR